MAEEEITLEQTFMSEAEARALLAGREERLGTRRMDPKAQLVGMFIRSIRPPGMIPTPAESREQLRTMVRLMDAPAVPLSRVEDLGIPGPAGPIPARLYASRVNEDRGPLPVLTHFHGGGWVQGDLDTHHGTCSKLALWSGTIVVAVDYRLAPEHKFPAAVEDCLAAYRWLRRHARELGADPDRVAVAGDSAGGNLAAVLSQQTAKAGESVPTFQVLIYPALNFSPSTGSHRELVDAYILPRERIQWYGEQYLPDPSAAANPCASPLRADSLEGQPPALIITCGFDPLRDEGQAYADRLAAAGVPVVHHEYPGQIHAFISLTKVIPQGDACLREIADYARRQFERPA